MIHVEKDGYITVDSRNCYILGRKPKEERKTRKEAYLDDCTYHATLWQALQAYAKECIADSLLGREIEWAEAIATANGEMRRLRELFKSSLELGEQDAENAYR